MQPSSNFMRLVRMWVFLPLLLVCSASAEESSPADEVVLLNTNNVHAVEAGAASPARFRLDGPHRITSIKTYHWNAGRGAPAARFVITAIREHARKVKRCEEQRLARATAGQQAVGLRKQRGKLQRERAAIGGGERRHKQTNLAAVHW